MLRIAWSSAIALAFGYVALSIVALFLFAVPLWYAWRQTVDEGRAEILQEDSQHLVDLFNQDGASGLAKWIDARIQMQIVGERLILLADASDKPLAGNLGTWPQEIPDQPGTYTIEVKLNDRWTQAVFVHTALPDGYNLLVGRDISRLEPLESRFWYGLAAAISVVVVVGVIGGLIIRRVLLAPVQSVSQATAAIVAGDLKRRLPVPGASGELDALSRTINSLLDQIEQLVHGVRNVSNSIAHDLRTPLTELRSRLEELSLTKPSQGETFSEIEGAVADVDRVIRVFDALLRLAEIDTGARRAAFVDIDASELVNEAVDFYSPAAEVRGISLSLDRCDEITVSGDVTLLAQAITNLIDNALKYAPINGHIVIAVVRGGDGTVGISVADDGPGIPDHEKPKVTDRFYRGDASRGTPGTGLGLSLVAAIAKLHGGRLELEDNHPGLRATIILVA